MAETATGGESLLFLTDEQLRKGIEVGNIHEHGNLGWVLRIDEGSDVRDTERTKDLLAFR